MDLALPVYKQPPLQEVVTEGFILLRYTEKRNEYGRASLYVSQINLQS